jgi:CRP-like cAMP-binding protein
MESPYFLKSIFKPQNFSEEELSLILDQFDKVSFAKNDFLIPPGKVANYYYYLESGYARSFVLDIHGNEVTTKFFSRSDIVIDWNSYFLKTPSKEGIQALSDGTAWKISFENFMKLFHIEAFREVGRTRLVNTYFELKNHTISMISDDAKDRYIQLLQEKKDIAVNVPLKHIASYLGITDTSLSRIRKEMVKG